MSEIRGLAWSLALALVVLVSATGGLTACEEDSGPPPELLGLQLYTAPGSANPYDQVSWIVVRAEGADSDLHKVVRYTGPGGSAALSGIPYSNTLEGLRVVVEGWTGTETQLLNVVSRGSTPLLTVFDGSTPSSMPVLFARVNTFLSATSSDTGQVQSLAKGRVGHAIAKSRQGLIVVSGGCACLVLDTTAR